MLFKIIFKSTQVDLIAIHEERSETSFRLFSESADCLAEVNLLKIMYRGSVRDFSPSKSVISEFSSPPPNLLLPVVFDFIAEDC